MSKIKVMDELLANKKMIVDRNKTASDVDYYLRDKISMRIDRISRSNEYIKIFIISISFKSCYTCTNGFSSTS